MSLLSNLRSLFGKVMHDEDEEKATQSYLTFTYVNVFRIQQIKSAEFCFLTFKGHESSKKKSFFLFAALFPPSCKSAENYDFIILIVEQRSLLLHTVPKVYFFPQIIFESNQN